MIVTLCPRCGRRLRTVWEEEEKVQDPGTYKGYREELSNSQCWDCQQEPLDMSPEARLGRALFAGKW